MGEKCTNVRVDLLYTVFFEEFVILRDNPNKVHVNF